MKTKNIFSNQKGMVPIWELLLIVAVIGALGFVGYRAYQAKKKPASTTQAEVSTAPEVKKKTFTMQYEKIKLTYPETFTLTDTSTTYAEVTPGTDNVKLAKANGFTLGFQTGLFGIGGACEDCRVVISKPITFLGARAFVNFVEREGQVKVAIVTDEADDWFGAGIMGRNIRIRSGGGLTPMAISIDYASGAAQNPNTFANSDDVKEAIEILEGATY